MKSPWRRNKESNTCEVAIPWNPKTGGLGRCLPQEAFSGSMLISFHEYIYIFAFIPQGH